MKTTNKSPRILTLTLFAFLSLGISQAAFAGTSDSTPVELKFLGNLKNQPVFQLNLNNELAGEFTIVIKDARNEMVFTETVKGKDISRKYQFLTEELDASKLIFEITNKKDQTSTVYSINRQTRTVQDLVINKL